MAFLAVLVLALHLVWLVLVVIGAIWTRGKPAWTALHILSLLWGIVVEVGSWPCPLTLAEQYFEGKIGAPAYSGGFLLHYLDALVYPHLPSWLVTCLGVGACTVNLGIYFWRLKECWILRRMWD